MADYEAPVVNHDDGIFEFQKKLEFGETSVTELALEVISAYLEKERKRVGKLKRPVVKVGGLPEKIVMECMRQNAGVISFAPTQLYCHSTKFEHENAKQLNSFFSHAEPVYDDRDGAVKYHGAYCWKVALLNAYRVLDLTRYRSIKYPNEWIHIDVGPQDQNFAGLLASAAYHMGLYYAKAQAMAKASVALRGTKMSKAKEGRFTPLGEMVYAACAEIEKREGKLPTRASKMVMELLEKRGKASTKGALWIIFVGTERTQITAKKLGKFISRYRDRAET